MKQSIVNELLRSFPFALVGGLGLVSLASGMVELDEHLTNWVTVWQSVTQPIWDFLFGWFFSVLDISFPALLKDYLSVGVIFVTSAIRANPANFPKPFLLGLLSISVDVLVWPRTLFVFTELVFRSNNYYVEKYAVEEAHEKDGWNVKLGVPYEQQSFMARKVIDPIADEIRKDIEQEKKRMSLVFFETVVLALIMIAASFSVLHFGR